MEISTGESCTYLHMQQSLKVFQVALISTYYSRLQFFCDFSQDDTYTYPLKVCICGSGVDLQRDRKIQSQAKFISRLFSNNSLFEFHTLTLHSRLENMIMMK